MWAAVQRHGYAFHGVATELSEGDSVLPSGGFQYWILPVGRQIPLQPGENVVGRDPRVQVWLDWNGVSRRHARIMVNGDGVTIEDLNSKNGTHVSGERITASVPLTDGDQIKFGSTPVMFRIWSADQTTKSEGTAASGRPRRDPKSVQTRK